MLDIPVLSDVAETATNSFCTPVTHFVPRHITCLPTCLAGTPLHVTLNDAFQQGVDDVLRFFYSCQFPRHVIEILWALQDDEATDYCTLANQVRVTGADHVIYHVVFHTCVSTYPVPLHVGAPSWLKPQTSFCTLANQVCERGKRHLFHLKCVATWYDACLCLVPQLWVHQTQVTDDTISQEQVRATDGALHSVSAVSMNTSRARINTVKFSCWFQMLYQLKMDGVSPDLLRRRFKSPRMLSALVNRAAESLLDIVETCIDKFSEAKVLYA